MKAKEFSKFLDKYTSFLLRVGSAPQSDSVSKVSVFFGDRADAVTVLAALKMFSDINTEILRTGNSTREFITVILTANSLLKEFGKPAISKDIELTKAAFEKFGNFDIASVLEAAAAPKAKPVRKANAKAKVKTIRYELVRSYCEKLEAAIGDESCFPAIYTELSERKALSADELKELSKQFRKQSAKSGAAALKNIWARHFNVVDGRARDKATAGRTAA